MLSVGLCCFSFFPDDSHLLLVAFRHRIFKATQIHSAWPPPPVGMYNEYWRWFRPLLLGKKRRVLRSSGPCYQDCWHTGLLYTSLIGSLPLRTKVKGNDLTCDEPHDLSSSSSVAFPKSDANVRLGSVAS